MREAVRIVQDVHGGRAPSLLSVYRHMRTRGGHWSNARLHAVVWRAINAGLLEPDFSRGAWEHGHPVPVRVTPEGEAIL
jgi:hypothetical protein